MLVVPESPHLKARARGCRFHRLRNGWEVGGVRAQVHHKWKRQHRFVVVRRPLPEEPAETAQRTFFKDQRDISHVFVTNLTLSPWRVYRFYRPRAAIEKNIRALLYDYPLGKIPTDSWTANVACFPRLLLAADLVHWFKRLCLPPEYRTATLDTIRTDCLVLPARLVRVHKQTVVKLPHDYHYRHEFLAAVKRLQRLRLPTPFRLCT